MENEIEASPHSGTTDFLPSDGASCSVLFIGGSMDGKWKPDPGYHILQCAVPGTIPSFGLPDPQEYSVRTQTYRRERIRAEKQEWVIYVLDSLRIDQAMGRLIRGYSPQNVKEHAPPLAGASVETGGEG